MRLLFSVYKTDVWKFGRDGVYFAVGPLRFSRKTLLEALEEGSKNSSTVLDNTVDYVYKPSLYKDEFTLYLKDGTEIQRVFGRSTQADIEKGTVESTPSTTSQNFQRRLQERCGY